MDRPTVLTAILRGKVASVEASEDLSTAAAFGLLAWLPASVGFVPFLEAVRAPLGGLADIVSVEVELWPWWDKADGVPGAEPDAVLTLVPAFGRRRLIVVECKRRSEKSGKHDRDQLMRQAANGLEVARERNVDFAGVVYLTEHSVAPESDLEASRIAIKGKALDASAMVRWLSWRDLAPILEHAAGEVESLSPIAKQLAIDLVSCLNRWGLERYRGISAVRAVPEWTFSFDWTVRPAIEWTFTRGAS